MTIRQELIDRAKAVPIESIAAPGLKRQGKELVGPCPWCSEGEDRFWINILKNIWGNRCGCHPVDGADGIEFAKLRFECEFDEAVKRLAGEPASKPNGGGTPADKVKIWKWETPPATHLGIRQHHYRDNGVVVHIKYKRDQDGAKKWGKFGHWYRCDPSGRASLSSSDWYWRSTKPDDYIDVPYFNQNLNPFDNEVTKDLINWPEGEKDADTLAGLNFLAFTVGGAGDIPEAAAQCVKGRPVVIFADNDAAGAKSAQAKAAFAHRYGALSVRIVKFDDYKDVSDWTKFWVDSGTDRATVSRWLEEAVDKAPLWQPSGGATPAMPLTLNEWAARNIPPPDFICGSWLTTTSRTLMFASTGIGKTMFGIALAFAIASGADFLHWRGARPARVLFVDGEMSTRLLKQRLADEEKRHGSRPANLYVLSHHDIEDFSPLNTAKGQAQIEAVLTRIGGADLLIFDNIMSLIDGDMTSELSWRQVVPWSTKLTGRRIGQVWIHHTGHDETKSYGTKTREWQMDTVIQLEEVKVDLIDICFKLSFPKAREKTPDTRVDFMEKQVSLVNDRWSCGDKAPAPKGKGKPSPMALKFLAALRDATIGSSTPRMHRCPTATRAEWTAECVKQGLIDREAKPNYVRASMSKYRVQLISHNLIAANETVAWTLT